MIIRIVTAIVVLFWSIVIYLAFLSALPYNPVSLDYSSELNLKLVLPEGWGFFSRDPREEDLYIYKKNDGQWFTNPLAPLARKENLFGISRQGRALSVESAILLDNFDINDWTQCQNSIFEDCILSNNDTIVTIENSSPFPILCDTVCFILKEPIPWAWSKNMHFEGMPSRALYINVLCP